MKSLSLIYDSERLKNSILNLMEGGREPMIGYYFPNISYLKKAYSFYPLNKESVYYETIHWIALTPIKQYNHIFKLNYLKKENNGWHTVTSMHVPLHPIKTLVIDENGNETTATREDKERLDVFDRPEEPNIGVDKIVFLTFSLSEVLSVLDTFKTVKLTGSLHDYENTNAHPKPYVYPNGWYSSIKITGFDAYSPPRMGTNNTSAALPCPPGWQLAF